MTNTGGLRPWYGVLFLLERYFRNMDWGLKFDIGPGLYMGHVHGITLNPKVKIGKNCNIHKGVTIGQENRGKRKGVPVIGDEVWIGINAIIVGNIHIGNDVLIVPGAYINFDVPDHPIVVGNPGAIRHAAHATDGYINRKI